jgi:hypothetical protein
MRTMLLSICAVLCTVASFAAEPVKDGLADLRWMEGEWRGIGDPDGKGFKPYVTNRFLKVSLSGSVQ